MAEETSAFGILNRLKHALDRRELETELLLSNQRNNRFYVMGVRKQVKSPERSDFIAASQQGL
jgi:hypothetical protein